MNKKIVLVFSLFLTACSLGTKNIRPESSDPIVELISVQETAHLRNGFDSFQSKCGVPVSVVQDKDKGLKALSIFIKPLIGMVIDAIDAQLESKIAQYTAAYSDSEEMLIYERTRPEELRFPCLRFVRYGESGDPKHGLDILIKLQSNNDHFTVETLGLKLNDGLPKSSDTTFSVVAKLKIIALWREGNRGYRETIADVNLFETVIKEGDEIGNFDSITVPFIPYSPGEKSENENGRVILEFTVAEVGTVPAGLKLLADAFGRSKGDIADMMLEAVEARFGSDDDEE